MSADGAVTDVSQEGAEQQRRGDGVGASISDLPESGYGWVILSACAVLAWWFVGINYTWGVLQATFVDDGVAQASTLSFVGSLAMAWAPLLAIANAKMIKWIGTQKAALLGVSLIGLGEILGNFATRSISGLFICIGCITGVGAR